MCSQICDYWPRGRVFARYCTGTDLASALAALISVMLVMAVAGNFPTVSLLLRLPVSQRLLQPLPDCRVMHLLLFFRLQPPSIPCKTFPACSPWVRRLAALAAPRCLRHSRLRRTRCCGSQMNRLRRGISFVKYYIRPVFCCVCCALRRCLLHHARVERNTAAADTHTHKREKEQNFRMVEASESFKNIDVL